MHKCWSCGFWSGVNTVLAVVWLSQGRWLPFAVNGIVAAYSLAERFALARLDAGGNGGR